MTVRPGVDMSNALLVQLLTQPHLQSSESARTGPSSNKYMLSLNSCTTMNKVQLEQAIDMNTHALQKDVHDQRIKQLRKMVKEIEEDDWRYEPVEKLIGLSFKSTVEIVNLRARERDKESPGSNHGTVKSPGVLQEWN